MLAWLCEKRWATGLIDDWIAAFRHRACVEDEFSSNSSLRSLPAVAYLWSGTPVQVSVDSESAAPESAYTIVVGQTDGQPSREGLHRLP